MLPPSYEPHKYEKDIYDLWEKSGAFIADPKSSKPHFSIAMPPPNETSVLHLGGALFITLEDIIARHARQQGNDVLWLPGTDHAAIATNVLVEKQLAEEGTDKHALGREAFIDRVKAFAGANRGTMINQMRAMGASCDWSRLRYTLDEALNRCVNEVFVKMYKDGLIYRGHRIVNWDPRLETTVSDDELVYKEAKTPLYTLKFGPFQIATARPETKFGDKYIVMHPDDKRYGQYKHGDTFELEWINGPITATVIKDEAVEPAFGTGVMTITPWHDRTDFEIAERHALEKDQIIGFDGRLLPVAGEFAGQAIDEARPKIVDKLKEKGLLAKTDDNYTHNIALNDRGKGVIEPQIMLQWFVDVSRPAVEWKGQRRSLKEVMRATVEDGDIKLIPKRFEKVYFHWIDNLRDWCISRQIWWGHRVPVWYKKPLQRKMGFDQTVMNQLFKGKTKTYRQKNYKFRVGSRVLAENTQTGKIFGMLTIKNIQKTTVGKIDLEDKAHYVTYKNQGELITALKKYYPDRQMGADYPIWVYEYDFEPKEIEPEIYVGAQPPAGEGWVRDEDTLDTWFSSALWTWSTLVDPKLAKDYSLSLEDLLQKSLDFRTYHPTDVMETGWDILFFWVARMILATTYTTGQIPFKDVYLHGLVRTEAGKKMSKSDPETIIDPLAVVAEYGTDALRLALAAGAGGGQDQSLGKSDIVAGRNFANKLWNIARFTQNLGIETGVKPSPKTPAEHWILNKLSISVEAIAEDLAKYKFSEAHAKLYHFVWDDLADWYVEVSKVEPNPVMLTKMLKDTLKLAHPFAPFVSETIWQQLKLGAGPVERSSGSTRAGNLISAAWPEPPKADAKKAAEFEELIKLVTEIRRVNSVLKNKASQLTYAKSPVVEANAELISRLAGLKSVTKGPAKGLKLVNSGQDVWLDADPKEYLAQLQTQQKELQASVKRLEQRLKAPGYAAKAPKKLVDQTKQELADEQALLAKLEAEIQALKS